MFKDKEVKEYPLIDSSTLSMLEYPEPRFLLYPLFTDKSVNSIYGDTGGGKTLFSMSCGMYIASNRNFLKWKCNNSVPVLYVEGELPGEEIRDRRNSIEQNFIKEGKKFRHEWFITLTLDDCEMNGLDGIAPLAVSRDMSTNLEDQKDWGRHGRKMIENLQERIFKKCGVKPLTFLDNIGCLTDIDENKQSDWTPLLSWFNYRKTKGFPITWLHHSNKMGSSSGSEAKRRALNTEIRLEQLGDDQRFNMPGQKNLQTKMSITKARHFGGSSMSKQVLLTMDEDGNWNQYPPLAKVDFVIIDLFNQGLSAKEIIEHELVNIGKASVYNKIKKFLKEGILKGGTNKREVN